MFTANFAFKNKLHEKYACLYSPTYNTTPHCSLSSSPSNNKDTFLGQNLTNCNSSWLTNLALKHKINIYEHFLKTICNLWISCYATVNYFIFDFILDLFNDVFNCYDILCQKVWIINLKGCGKKRSRPNLRYYPDLCLQNHENPQSR
jgi:hypothetical protein